MGRTDDGHSGNQGPGGVVGAAGTRGGLDTIGAPFSITGVAGRRGSSSVRVEETLGVSAGLGTRFGSAE